MSVGIILHIFITHNTLTDSKIVLVHLKNYLLLICCHGYETKCSLDGFAFLFSERVLMVSVYKFYYAVLNSIYISPVTLYYS